MAMVMFANPSNRGGKKKMAKSPARKSPASKKAVGSRAPARKSPRRYKRNPIASTGGVVQQLKNGAIGGAGAFAVDVVLTKVPFLAGISTGAMAPLVRGAVAYGVGIGVGKIAKNRALGNRMAEGAIAVQTYNLLRANLGPKMGLAGGDGLMDSDFYSMAGGDGLVGTDYFDDPEPYMSGAGSIYDQGGARVIEYVD